MIELVLWLAIVFAAGLTISDAWRGLR